MRLLKRTYGMPSDLVDRFEHSVARGGRGKVIAQLVENWLEEQKTAELRASIIEGCQEMWDIYLETEKEFHPLEEEVARKIDNES